MIRIVQSLVRVKKLVAGQYRLRRAQDDIAKTTKLPRPLAQALTIEVAQLTAMKLLATEM
jgi:hypothetical protein